MSALGSPVGVRVTYRLEERMVTRYEPLHAGMCDVLLDDALWVASHECRYLDGTPLLDRREAIRAANIAAIRSLRMIRADLVREWHRPWPGCEHGKAIVGMAIDGAIAELERGAK